MTPLYFYGDTLYLGLAKRTCRLCITQGVRERVRVSVNVIAIEIKRFLTNFAHTFFGVTFLSCLLVDQIALTVQNGGHSKYLRKDMS